MRRLLGLSVVLIPLAGLTFVAGPAPATAATAVTSYHVVDLGLLPGDELSVPFGLNASGDVVGFSGALNQMPMPFVYTDATGLTPLALPPGATSGIAYEINDARQATGRATVAPATSKALRWSAGGEPQVLGALGNASASSYGYGINSTGSVAGWSDVSPSVFEGQEAFLYTDGRGMRSVTPGARPAFGFDVNDAMQVTGEYEFDAFRWTHGTIEDISGTVGGVTTGEAINASGQVAITRELPDSNLAFRWTDGIGIEPMGLQATDEPTNAHGINSAGDVVGRGRVPGSQSMGGYLFSAAAGLVDLNAVLDAASTDWYISEAYDINDAGQIVAEATNFDTFQQHAVRLDPAGTSGCVSSCLRSAVALTAADTATGARVVATVTVRDETGAPMPGATVDVTWRTPAGTRAATATTSSTGVAKLDARGTHGTYVVKITSIVRSGWTFDPEHSETTDRIVA